MLASSLSKPVVTFSHRSNRAGEDLDLGSAIQTDNDFRFPGWAAQPQYFVLRFSLISAKSEADHQFETSAVPDTFTGALLAALNASAELMLRHPVCDEAKEEAPLHIPKFASTPEKDGENRFASTISFGMAKLRSVG